MTETQALKLLQVLLMHVRDDVGNDDVPIEEVGYEGPLPEGCASVAEVAVWLRLNIKTLGLGS